MSETETATCGRRMLEFGPWKREEGLDEWKRDRWAATREEADAKVAEFTARHPGGLMGDPMWPGDGQQPRTCSFCGGIHPEDAIALIESGWRLVATGKSYKRYMKPPSGSTFIPPVKLYGQHFDEDQAARLNAAIRERFA